MHRLPQILICDDDSLFHMAIKHSLKGNYDCRSAYNTDEALAIIRRYPIDIVLLDVQMRTGDEGLKAISKLKEASDSVSIVMTSGLSDYRVVKEALRLGAVDYLVKGVDSEELEHAIRRVLERSQMLRRRGQQNFELEAEQRRHVLVGTTPAIERMRRTLERIRISPANVVITGETGTGKEVIARQLRKTLPDGTLEPFVAVDSSTIQSSMAESLLFGHEKGAFTGADRSVKGIFEEADGGTLYFDEISNMPLDIQAKLLRALQEKEILRLGSSRTIELSFRVICATNRDLEELCKTGQFKEDLYQRLNVLPIQVPPLRERTDDIPLLIQHFLEKQGDAGRLDFSEEAVAALKTYPWPGNVRELGNVVAYVVAMTEGATVELSDLPPRLRDICANQRTRASDVREPRPEGTFYERVENFERGILTKEFENTSGNVRQLALTLGMDRSHLYAKLKQYGIYTPRETRK